MGNEILAERINIDFAFHPATPDTGPRHDRIRRLCRSLAHELTAEVPTGRELSCALTALEEVMMWSNAGIAREEAHRALFNATDRATVQMARNEYEEKRDR